MTTTFPNSAKLIEAGLVARRDSFRSEPAAALCHGAEKAGGTGGGT